MSGERIVRLVNTHSFSKCDMCTDSSRGHRWEYKSYQFCSHVPPILIICQKCIYREIYGSKDRAKAVRNKTLHQLNYNYCNTTPNAEVV